MKIKGVRTVMLLIGIIFTFVGIILFSAGCVVMAKHISDKQNYEKTQANITEINHTNSNAFIEYTIDGITYEGKLNEYSTNMQVGDPVWIYYDPEDPYEFISDSKIFEIIFISLGGFFTVIGVVFMIICYKKKRKVNELIVNGDKLSGTIVAVRTNYNIRVNNRYPFIADCEVINPYDNEKYLYRSENVMEDISMLVGMTVTVYVDRNDRSKYYVDIQELLNSYNSDFQIHDYR